MAKFNSWSNQRRLDGMSGVTVMCAAIALSFVSISVVAQTAFEFEDPLEEVRTQIESDGSSTSAIPAGSSGQTDNWDAKAKFSPTAKAKGPVTVFAEKLGLPTAGVVGLGVLGLLGLLLGLVWLFMRRKSARSSKHKNSDLYAVSDGARGRRVLESGAKVTRNRKEFLDTTERATTKTHSTAAARAARILDNEEDDYLDSELEDQNEYVLDDEIVSGTGVKTAVAGTVGAAAAALGVAKANATEAVADDPETWKRPNLERLKASIRDDWNEKEETPVDPETAKLQSEAEVFADLFGDDVPPSAMNTEGSKSSVLDMIDKYEDEEEEGALPVSSLQAAVEKSANIEPAATEVRGDLPSRDDALRRIRALRESVKAS